MILIGAIVFGAAFAGGWAVAILFDLGDYGVHILQASSRSSASSVMVSFVRDAQRAEPFLTRD